MKKMRLTVAIITATAAAAALAGCAPTDGGDSDARPLTWVSYGGAFQDNQIAAWQEPATSATGITFENVSPFDNAQLQAMVEAKNVVWDIVTPDGVFNLSYCGELFEDLSDIVDPADFKPGTAAGPCSAPVYVFSNVFSYVADAYPDTAPERIQDFFDTEKFPGQRIYVDAESGGLLEAALVADGVAPEDLYPLDLDRAFAKLDTIRDQLTLAPTLAAAGQMLADGQGTMTLLVSGRTISTANEGVDLRPVWDFTTYAPGTLAIPKGSPRVAEAKEAIAAILTPESAIAYAELTGTAPALAAVDSASVKYTDLQAMFDPFADGGMGTVVPRNEEYWAEHFSEITKAWNAWKLG